MNVRFGALGANITPLALFQPAGRNDAAEAVAIAARDRGRVPAMAERDGVGTVMDDHPAAIDHPDVDAVHNPPLTGRQRAGTVKAPAAGVRELGA